MLLFIIVKLNVKDKTREKAISFLNFAIVLSIFCPLLKIYDITIIE